MRRFFLFLFLFLVLLLLPLGVRWVSFYDLQADKHTPPPDYVLEDVPAMVPTPAFSNITFEAGPSRGQVLLDRGHGNEFTLDEISFLDGQLAALGYELVPYAGADLASALRQASALVVVAPLRPFTDGELLALEQFVSRDGRLLLLGDPTRYSAVLEEDEFGFVTDVTLNDDELPLNGVANSFGIVFSGDYLYNTLQNEGNFRNIIVNIPDDEDTSVTERLDRVVFYGSHSVHVARGGIPVFPAGENTWSSATDRPGNLYAGALSADERVLAIGDVNFLIEPYATAYDNGRLAANIAAFLTSGRRDFVLADFPYFFGNPVDLIYTGSPDLGPDAIDEIVTLQDAFGETGQSLALAAERADEHDAIYLGIYNEAEDVQDFLFDAGISLQIEPPLTEPDTAATEDTNDEAGTPSDEADQDVVRQLRSPLGNVQCPARPCCF